MAFSWVTHGRTWQWDNDVAFDASGRSTYGYLAPVAQPCASPGPLFAGRTTGRARGTEVEPLETIYGIPTSNGSASPAHRC